MAQGEVGDDTGESFTFHHIALTTTTATTTMTTTTTTTTTSPSYSAASLPQHTLMQQQSHLTSPHLHYSSAGSRSFNSSLLHHHHHHQHHHPHHQHHSSLFDWPPGADFPPSFASELVPPTMINNASVPLLSRHSSFGNSSFASFPKDPGFSSDPKMSGAIPVQNAQEFSHQEVGNRQPGSNAMASSYSRKNKNRWQQVRGRVKFLVAMRSTVAHGNRHSKRLLMLVILNVAYSTVELLFGLLTGRIGLVSDSFHLTFGCGVLTFSLFAMVVAKRDADDAYTFGYKRLEILAAFTNALFLLFLCFSLAVEALHVFVQDESEHKHYLIVSAVTNLVVNLLGVWFFRSYARVRVVYRKAEDMNNHSICLHVISDSIRSAGVILASWLLLLGVKYAETLCLGLVAITVFSLTFPLFKASGGVLLQMVPPGVSRSAFHKCLRQVFPFLLSSFPLVLAENL